MILTRGIDWAGKPTKVCLFKFSVPFFLFDLEGWCHGQFSDKYISYFFSLLPQNAQQEEI